MSDISGKTIDFEMGNMGEDEIVEFFQELIDIGLAWQLQGSYGRMAKHLIEGGHCTTPKQEVRNDKTHRP